MGSSFARSAPAQQHSDPGASTGVASSGVRGNAFRQGEIRRKATGQGPGSDPGGSFDQATKGPLGELPFRDELEASFGMDLGFIEVHLGGPDAAAGLSSLGATGAAAGDVVVFDTATPDKDTVAHEVTHVLQQGGGVAADTGSVSSRGSGAESQANRVAASVVAGQPVTESFTSASPAVHRDDPTWEETGNLIGSPPVRSRTAPPNTSVVENQRVYGQRLGVAEGMKASQQARADSFLDGSGQVTDYRYWFSKVYSYVTENEIRFAKSSTYYYPSYVMASVAYFEQIYADNCAAFDNGGQVEDHWRQAFEQGASELEDVQAWRAAQAMAAADPSGIARALIGLGAIIDLVEGAVDTLVSSMQAHIRFDLPRAESWVFNNFYSHMPGVQISDFRSDFMSMSGVFDQAAASMNGDMAERLGLPVDLAPRLLQDTAMSLWFDADMGTERADTWRRAEILNDDGSGGSGPYAYDSAGGLGGDVTTSDNLAPINDLSEEALRPSMDSSASDIDDDEARDRLTPMSGTAIAAIPLTDKVRLIRAMLSGSCTNDDETQILRVLQNAGGGLATVVDGTNAWDLLYKMNGDEYHTCRSLLRTRYYPLTSQNEALRLVRQCIDGETSEWEEAMVADIFEDRSDNHALVSAVGAAYGGDRSDYWNGLNKLLWQLDGAEDSRIEALFGRD
jgi:hypothetical protein